ncbi:MAG: hypothetical protein J6U97_05980 [Bacteroidaceae bacterium]|nr:hypothetical protein [Bacteroidaceae bacterium]
MSNAYRAVVQSGGGAAVGDATAADVLTGKTFSGAVGSGVAGTMPNNGAVSVNLTTGQTYTVPEGYHNGQGTVTAPSAGSYDTSFTPTIGSGSNIAATNCTIGKYYIMYISSAYGSQVLTGCTQIAQFDASGDGKTRVLLVEATAATIGAGNAMETTARLVPVELTLT